MKAKKVKKVETADVGAVKKYSSLIEGEAQSGNAPMTLKKVLSLLREYQAIQRGGYWKHDDDGDSKRIKVWHRAIDAAICVVDEVSKGGRSLSAVTEAIAKGDYEKIVPTEKSVKMDEDRIFGKADKCVVVGRAVRRK